MKKRTSVILLLLLTFTGCASTTFRGEEVRQRLADTPSLAAHDIAIDEYQAGFITLNGRVASHDDRQKIERIARGTTGVKEVRSNLIVDSSSITVREGAGSSLGSRPLYAEAVVSDITDRISDSPELQRYELRVDVSGDTATLRGEVGHERERIEAERIARQTSGIQRVNNELVVVESYHRDQEMSREVRRALFKKPNLDLRDVEIYTRDSIVTLRGSQPTRHDIDYLASVVRAVPGVHEVRSELAVRNSYSPRS